MFRGPISAVAFALALVAAPARAEVGVGPPVLAGVPLNARLVDVLHTDVVTDDPSAVIDATISVTVRAGGQDFALPSVAVRATGAPQRLDQRLPPAAVARIAQIRRYAPGSVGLVTYTIIAADPRWLDQTPVTDTERSRVTFSPPVRSARPTRIGLHSVLVTGSRPAQAASGTVALAQPRDWPRTSEAGASLATFSPLPISPGCHASLIASAVVVAVRDPVAYVARVGGAGDTVRAGRWYRVRATRGEFLTPSATAVAVRRIGRHRYAGARVDVRFEPGCPQGAAHDRRLIDDLLRAVRGARTALRLSAV
jgi:hypothetical protein